MSSKLFALFRTFGTPEEVLGFQIVKNRLFPTEARQAVKVPPMKFVLSLSIVGAIIGLLVAWLVFSG